MLRRLLCAYWMTKYVGKFRFEILDDCMENAKDLKGLLFLPHPVYRIVRENSMVRSVCYRTKRDNFSKRPKATLLAFWLRTESGTGRQFHAEYTHTLHVRKGTWLDFFVFFVYIQHTEWMWLTWSTRCCLTPRDTVDTWTTRAQPNYYNCSALIVLSTASELTSTVSPVAPERIWKWGAPVRSESGAPIWREASGKKFLVMPLHFLGSKSTFSRFGEHFSAGQYSLVSSLFAVLLLTVPPRAQPFVKVGDTCSPCPMESAPLPESDTLSVYCNTKHLTKILSVTRVQCLSLECDTIRAGCNRKLDY